MLLSMHDVHLWVLVWIFCPGKKKFSDGLKEVIDYIKERCPVVEARPYSDDYPKEEREARGDDAGLADVNFDEL